MKYLYLHGLGQTPDSWNRTIKETKVSDNSICINLVEMVNCPWYCKNFTEALNNFRFVELLVVEDSEKGVLKETEIKRFTGRENGYGIRENGRGK